MAKEPTQQEEVSQARPEAPAPAGVHPSVQPVLARIPAVIPAATMTSLLRAAAPDRGGGVALGGAKPVGKVQLLRQIQRSFGNAYAQRVVQSYREPPEGEQSEGKGEASASGQEEEAGKAEAPRVQRQGDMRVSSPSDPAEKEAEATAKQVVSMPAPEGPSSGAGAPVRSGAEGMLRARRAAVEVSRQGEGAPRMTGQVASDIRSSQGGGQPLPASVRGFMEPRFRADFGQVRIHTGDKAARLNRQLSAQAFTQGQNIFFGRGKFQPETREGKELIAHELTHTIQQGAAVQQPGPGVRRSEGVQRSEDVSVKEQSAPQVQRLGISDALDYFADKANLIPGFRMFTIVLGVNPINMSRVERSAANILRAVVEFIPGGGLITQALDKYGVFEKVGGWVEQQLKTLGMVGSSIRQAVDRFLDSLSWRDIFDLGGVWERAKRIFTEPIDRIINFVKGLASDILKFIKDAILKPLAKLAEGTRGYDLLKAVLGQDPITGEPVPRNADTLIGGFMKLIGQEEIWNNLKKANAVARAWAWFQGAMGALVGFVREIPGLFMQALQSLEIADIVLLPRAFGKVASVFGSFIGRFLSWAGDAVWNLLEIIFAVVAPGALAYLKKAAGAFRTILRNPIGFVGNLVRAGMQGFRQFAGNFLTHLRASLIGWLTGAMSGAGIYIPQGFNLREIIKFVLSVLGLTWQNIRQKLVRAIGEPAVRALETGFDIVRTLVTQGPAAAWEKIQESLSNLREMVMEQIMTFVRDRVVQAAITRLLSMLSPAGAFIQAIIAIYNTVMFFVERLRQIAQVAASFIDSIAAIASGAIGAAASRVERTMAGLLTLVISFLARIAGLGRVSDAVTNVVNRVRTPIDRALDRVVDWIVAQARRLGRFIAQAGVPQDPRERLRLGMQAAIGAVNRLPGARIRAALIPPVLAAIRVRYGFQTLEPFSQGGRWWVRGRVNPEETGATTKEDTSAAPAGAAAAPAAGSIAAAYTVEMMITVPYRRATRVAQITQKTDTLITYRFLDTSLGIQSTALSAFEGRVTAGEIRPYVADRRGTFMGANPPRDGPVGRAIKQRYIGQGLYRLFGSPPVEQVKHPPSATGEWVNIADCDLSHEPEDAVTFWNREGYKHGPRSPEVRAFMTNPNNYIFEPSGPNRSRASRHGEEYRDPLKV